MYNRFAGSTAKSSKSVPVVVKSVRVYLPISCFSSMLHLLGPNCKVYGAYMRVIYLSPTH